MDTLKDNLEPSEPDLSNETNLPVDDPDALENKVPPAPTVQEPEKTEVSDGEMRKMLEEDKPQPEQAPKEEQETAKAHNFGNMAPTEQAMAEMLAELKTMKKRDRAEKQEDDDNRAAIRAKEREEASVRASEHKREAHSVSEKLKAIEAKLDEVLKRL